MGEGKPSPKLYNVHEVTTISKKQKTYGSTFVRAHAPSPRRSIQNFATMLSVTHPMLDQSFASFRGLESGFPTPNKASFFL
jgi:hypothetical protein